MKKIITLVALTTLWLATNAQLSQYNGALGVEFGCSKEAVKAMMSSKHPDAKFNQAKNNSLQWTDGKWAGEDVAVWTFVFTESNKLHSIKISLMPTHEYEIWDLYKSIKNLMVDKYGEPKDDIVNWKSPYTIDDKEQYGISALKNGKVDYWSFWQKSNNPADEQDYNAISVEILSLVAVRVTYQNGLLINEAIKQSNQKKQGDM